MVVVLLSFKAAQGLHCLKDVRLRVKAQQAAIVNDFGSMAARPSGKSRTAKTSKAASMDQQSGQHA